MAKKTTEGFQLFITLFIVPNKNNSIINEISLDTYELENTYISFFNFNREEVVSFKLNKGSAFKDDFKIRLIGEEDTYARMSSPEDEGCTEVIVDHFQNSCWNRGTEYEVYTEWVLVNSYSYVSCDGQGGGSSFTEIEPECPEPGYVKNDNGDCVPQIINELTGKAKCLNDSLTKKGNDFVKNILAKFQGTSEFDINIKSKDNVFRKSTSVELNGKTTYQPGSTLININISTNRLLNMSSLAGVRTILHEYIHANMYRKLNTKYPANGDLDFYQTYNAFKNGNFNATQQHETMAKLYINEMSSALKNIHQKLIPREVNYLEQTYGANVLNDIYESLAWQGLKIHKVQAWLDKGSDTTKINNTIQLYSTKLTKEFCK